MLEQERESQRDGRRWYVMTHQAPLLIEAMLDKERRGEFAATAQGEDGGQTEPFDCYVPYLYMRPEAGPELRRIFRHFVFIYASARRIRQITNAGWNVGTRYPLRHYRNRSGREITISHHEYLQLRDIIHNSQLKVFFGVPVTPLHDMPVGSKVYLKVENWENHPGIIEQIRLKRDGVSIRVAFNFLGQTKSVRFDDLHDGDVTFADDVTQQLITGDLIGNFAHEVSLLLGHCTAPSSDHQRRMDASRWRRLLSYADIQADDPDDRKRFAALMLICAAQTGEQQTAQKLQAQLLGWLPWQNITAQTFPSEQELCQATYADACMMLALFICTRDPRMRDAAKAYRRQHPQCPAIFGTIINKVRDLRTAKPVTNKEKAASAATHNSK